MDAQDQTSVNFATKRLGGDVRSLANSLQSINETLLKEIGSLAAEMRSEHKILDKRLDLLEQRIEGHGVVMKIMAAVGTAIGASILAVVVPNLFKVEDANGAPPIPPIQYHAPPPKPSCCRWQYGQASWYGSGFNGKRTANGEIFNQNAMTAAHKSLPFGTRVRVTNLANGRSAIVRINDRGSFVEGRVIHLSAKAALSIGMIDSGVAPVQLEVLPKGSNQR